MFYFVTRFEIYFEIGHFCTSQYNVYVVYFLIHIFTIPGILSYSMPVGQTIKNGKLTFSDTSYNGVIADDIYKYGTGILTDGKFGPDDVEQDKGWVGWSSSLTESPYVNITFEFPGVRKFKDVTLTVNVDKKRSHAVFSRSEIFFAFIEDQFSDTVLQYCPKTLSDDDIQFKRIVSLPLCENTARFIKLRLYFGGEWLLITEISFNSGILAYNLVFCFSLLLFVNPISRR